MHAPFAFGLTLALGGILGWKIHAYLHRRDQSQAQGRVAFSEDRIKGYQEEIARMKTSTASHLSREQRALIIKYVHDNAGDVTSRKRLFVYPALGGGSSGYAEQICAVISEAGIIASLGPTFSPKSGPNVYRDGIWIRGSDSSDPPTNELLYKALAKAGIKATAVEPERTHVVELIIGSDPNS